MTKIQPLGTCLKSHLSPKWTMVLQELSNFEANGEEYEVMEILAM